MVPLFPDAGTTTQEELEADRERPSWLAWLTAAAFALSVVLGLGYLLLAAGGGFAPGGKAARTISPGMDAPDFALPTGDGRTMRLNDYRGRAVFLAFVPTWTDPKTAAQARSLRAMTAEFDMAGAKVMLLGPDDAAAADRLHDSERLPFPVLLDAGGATAKRYGVPAGYRTTFVVTPQGGVKYRVGEAAIDAAEHGRQLMDVSKCCMDEVVASRAHGVGKPVGDYSLPRADAGGAIQTLLGDGTQRATVALFLSVRCPCSNSYNERVRDWARAYGPRGVRFVGIYPNRDETVAQIAAHAKTNGFPFPVFKDDRGLAAAHFGAGVTPEVYVLDAARTLRYAGRLDGSRDPAEAKTHELPDALAALTSGNGAVPEETRAFGCAIVK